MRAVPRSPGNAVVAPLLAFGQKVMRDLAVDSVMEIGLLEPDFAAWHVFSLSSRIDSDQRVAKTLLCLSHSAAPTATANASITG